MRYIKEAVFIVTYKPSKCEYTNITYYIADSMESAVKMCRDREPDCTITEVRFVCNAIRKTTKTIQVEY